MAIRFTEAIVFKTKETIELVGRQVGYVIHCKSNLQRLQAQLEELNASREAVEDKVVEAEDKGEAVQPDVQLWLQEVGNINAVAEELLKDENQAKLKCLHGFCPNLTIRHHLGRKSRKLEYHLVELYERREFPVISVIQPQELWVESTGEYLAFPSRTSIVAQIMDELENPDTHRIGVYGIEGVGKTTLVKEVYRQATEDKKLFDNVVILLDVKENPHLEGIQNKILNKLDMKIFDDENLDGRASRTSADIQDKNILVILDDVWEQIDLEALQLPSVATCKILLTCTSRESLSGMNTQEDFQLDILEEEEAWFLFKKKAGDVVKNYAIREVALQVAECCSGLPILVVTVASALRKQTTLSPWKDALRYLKKSDRQELTEKAYLCLEWSYVQLKDKELEQLFLLCGFAIWGKDIYLPALLKYSMGLGLFRKGYTVEEAQNALLTWVGKLKDSCLLTDSDDSRYVKMHNLVRDVANRIALRDRHILSSVEDRGDYEFKEWLDKDFFKKWTMKSIQSSTVPVLSEVPTIYPKLKLFYLHGTGDLSVEIPTNFFREIEELKVLSLTRLHMLSLPSSLQYLKNLHALFLDQCIVGDTALVGELSNLEILSFFQSNVKQLPKEIGKLTRLQLLDLSDCSELEVISPGVISSLERLQELRMRNSFNKWEVEGERSNASLSELNHLSQLSVLEVHIPNTDILPANLFSHEFERFNIVIGDAWVDRYTSREKFMAETTLKTLKLKLKLTTSIKELDEGLIWLLERCEDLSLSETQNANNIDHYLDTDDSEHPQHLQVINIYKIGLPNLTRLAVHRCDGLSFLLSSSVAKSFVQLKHLRISECQIMKEVVLSEGHGEENKDNLFPKLEQLELNDLPCLTRFCSGSYVEFAALKRSQLEKCPKLETFIFNHLSNRIQIYNEIKERGTNDENVETVAPYFLFDEKVKTLRLHGMEIKLMRLSEESPVFPLLEILEVKFCGLNNLKLSAISFRNLTIIEVTFCWRLQYLTTYSVAQSLVGLKKLKVDECKNMKEIFTSEGIEEDASNCEIVFSRLQHLELSDLISLERFCSRNCIVKVPSLQSSALQVNWCPFQLKISTDRVLEEVSDMQQDVHKSHTGREEVVDTTESACSLETNQKQHVPNTSEVSKELKFNAGELHDDRLVNNDGPLLPGNIAESSEHGVKAVIKETPINFLEHAEVMDLRHKQIVTNTPKNLQEADFGMAESLIEPLNANEGRPLQLKQLDGVQTDSLLQSISELDADIKHLQEELRAKEAERRDKQQRLADRLATVDRLSDSL
ncbi:disease resistance protein At4g27190-like [Rosa rugosa]|uniref:disease resistance protein At4g27190-like n=1 Tax=Rosa rugosa TaxID=74645 RepID=UPI002B405A88|nr:disease resistance protein At4g27190-like [Rosa rugosa]XP_062025862.1 disease resistance protein At4g27190-like [Rosa rugosa]